MSNKIYVLLTRGCCEQEILKVSSDRSKLERFIEAIKKRNPLYAEDIDIDEFDDYGDCDDSYFDIMPEEPIYCLTYNTKLCRFDKTTDVGYYIPSRSTIIPSRLIMIPERIVVRQLSLTQETDFMAVNGECKCIQHVPEYIEVYVRAKDENEAVINAEKAVNEYLKRK